MLFDKNNKYTLHSAVLNAVLFFLFLACSAEGDYKSELAVRDTKADTTFNKTKWMIKQGPDYPYRDQMVSDIVYNDTVRTLHKAEILDLLGAPDRINEGHLYYMIAQTRFGYWPLHTKSMVIKLSADSSIAWIKIHE